MKFFIVLFAMIAVAFAAPHLGFGGGGFGGGGFGGSGQFCFKFSIQPKLCES